MDIYFNLKCIISDNILMLAEHQTNTASALLNCGYIVIVQSVLPTTGAEKTKFAFTFLLPRSF